MLGILYESVMECIIHHYGMEVWEEVQDYIELDVEQMISTNPYPDSIFDQVIEVLTMIREQGDHNSYMELFGQRFVEFFSNYGFEKILKVAGRDFRDFLLSIDQLHDSNRFTFTKMKSPLFYVEKEDKDGALIHYQSRRRGFNYYIIGQLKECAKRFYKIEADVRVEKDLSNDDYNHVVFRVDFDNSAYAKFLSTHSVDLDLDSAISRINGKTFLDLFPFSFGMDKNLRLVYMGDTFKSLFKVEPVNRYLDDVFEVIRPTFRLTWDAIKIYSSSIIFEFENMMPLVHCLGDQNEDGEPIKVRVKGEMKFIPDLNIVLFLGHPILTSMQQMQKVGLYLNDLNKFDGSAEMLVFNLNKVTELQHHANLMKAFEAQQAWTVNLEATKSQLKAYRKKGKKLLYNMLPARIAGKIEKGVKPNTICENFDMVTILFLNTTEFATIVNNAEPIEVVSFVNDTINVYDSIVTKYDKVTKIETKADGSYMIVTGLEDNSRPSSAGSQNSSAQGSSTRLSSKGSMIKSSLFGSRISKSSKGSETSLSNISLNDDGEEPIKKLEFPEYNQVELICEVALELVENTYKLLNPFSKEKGSHLNIKVGFYTGSIVAGIVGTSNIQFCLFGDPVNTASRMCSNSLPNRICFGEASYEHLENSEFFTTEFRDTIEVKGKGSMRTFWLKGKKK